MKQKWHKLYGNYITYLILVGLGLYYISLIALDIWIFHAPDLSFSIPCFLLLTCPAVLSIVLAYKPQGFRTYGFYGYSFSYMSMPFLYFSLDPAEYAPQNGGEVARIGRDRIIFQYRPSIWAALTEYMPRDMVKRLDDVIRNERGGHFQRRPGA